MIETSSLSQRRVEEKAGFSRGYLSQLLAQNLDLKVWHLLKVLEVLDRHPGDFFFSLDPDRRQTAMARFAAEALPLSEEVDDVLGCLYGLGVESLSGLRRRLVRCEQAVSNLEETGLPTAVRKSREG
ncbi:MAG: hypothetical protein AAF657_02155 [Acidobacteriota bacterium]